MAEMENQIKNLLTWMGDDAGREGLRETPRRFLDAWEFWTSGYGQNPATVLKSFEDGGEKYDEMVLERDIPFFSSCEHHLAPFFGVMDIGYIPNGKIVGLSKMARLVEVFARRLQVQERLGVQVVDALMEHLHPKGAAVVIHARHLCMESRGVQKIGTITTTSALRGNFKEVPEVRAEFMGFINSARRNT